jgi:hypothetical protein
MKRAALTLTLVSILATSIFPQQPLPTPQPPARPAPQRQAEDDVVRITTNLVQVDAVITDKSGKAVTATRNDLD